MALAVGLWALAVGFYDAASARIPNVASLAGLLLALVALATDSHGWHGAGLVSCGIGFLLGGLIPLSGYLAGGLGAGDVKFSAVLGLLLGATGVLWMLLIAALLMGLASLLLLLAARNAAGTGKRRIPAGLAIAAGVWFVILGGPEFLIT
ncbi:MAG: prepilin peptidase [Pseudomonadota bacterium]|nr:prepilin peptidase [Gammaproteobacteria bacterium]MEC9357720.1 prepilin peptidase [Pseudomonadota bacterium]